MSERILCVDDDPNILSAYQRALRKEFQIEIALGGQEALEAVINDGPYAVVVADMQMPGMNGVELLRKVGEHAKETVRMMLTGNADQETALRAVNEGHIFRFMTKPCPPEAFAKALEAGIAQYRLITAERDLLFKTFRACVKVLTDVLATVSPPAFGRASRVRQLVHQLCRQLGLDDWEIEMAAMLSQIGCVSIPEEILDKAYHGKELSSNEQTIYDGYPLAGRQLIENIPRLERVAEMIGFQTRDYTGLEYPSGQDIPLGSRVLKAALDFDALLSAGYTNDTAIAEMHDRLGLYDPSVLAALRETLVIGNAYVIRRLKAAELVDGLTLADDIMSIKGMLLCAKGQEVTRSMRLRLRNYINNIGIRSPIKVFVPAEMADRFGEDAAIAGYEWSDS